MHTIFRRGLSVCAAVLLAVPFWGCTAESVDDLASTRQAIEGTDAGPMQTYITDWIQIDDLEDTSGDANLFLVNGDPYLPPGGTVPDDYIDWHELVTDGQGNIDEEALANHRRLDDQGAKDASAFPQANSCVGPASILDKMNLTYAAIANNNDYVFLGVQRAKNNGDAAYYWLFTKVEPEYVTSTANSCASGLDLLYHVSGPNGGSGDVLVRGLFRPSESEPALEVFQAVRTADVYAVDVIDIEYEVPGEGLLWALFEGEGIYSAVNTSPTEAGAMGYQEVVSRTGSLLGEHIFAEAGVPLDVFTGGSHCGNAYWASVLSRPSHSPTSDPKDLIGPFFVDFGSVLAAAALEATCDEDVTHYTATGTGADGLPIPEGNMVCTWSFGATDCVGDWDFEPGLHENITVHIVDNRNDCADDSDPASVTVTPDLGITAEGTDECTGEGFTVCANATGGLEPYTFLWEFDPAVATPPTTECPGHVDAPAGSYGAKVTVTDDRDCPADTTTSAKAYDPLVASLSAETFLCTDDSVTFHLTGVSGGDGTRTFSWSGCTPNSAGTSCTVNPADDAFCGSGGVTVHVDDETEECNGLDFEGSYAKVTTIDTTTCRVGVDCP